MRAYYAVVIIALGILIFIPLLIANTPPSIAHLFNQWPQSTEETFDGWVVVTFFEIVIITFFVSVLILLFGILKELHNIYTILEKND